MPILGSPLGWPAQRKEGRSDMHEGNCLVRCPCKWRWRILLSLDSVCSSPCTPMNWCVLLSNMGWSPAKILAESAVLAQPVRYWDCIPPCALLGYNVVSSATENECCFLGHIHWRQWLLAVLTINDTITAFLGKQPSLIRYSLHYCF